MISPRQSIKLLSIYYGGKQFQRGCRGACGNYVDIDTGDVYWISGPKKNGEDRYSWAAKAPVEIDEDAKEEYWTTIREQPERKEQSIT